MDIVIILLRVALVLVCLFMGLVILMQRSKQEGLGAAFGASMTDSVFGAQTTNVLVKATVWCSVLFFGIVLALDALLARQHGSSALDALKGSGTPAALVAPTNSPAADPSAKPADAPAPAATNAPAAP